MRDMRLARWRKTFGKLVEGCSFIHSQRPRYHFRHHTPNFAWSNFSTLKWSHGEDQWSGRRGGEEARQRTRVHLVELDELRKAGKLGATGVQRESC